MYLTRRLLCLRQIADKEAAKKMDSKPTERADPSKAGDIGASMPGTVVDVRTAVGKTVKRGDPVVTLSAMKMETVISSPVEGRVKRIVTEVSFSSLPVHLKTRNKQLTEVVFLPSLTL